MSVDPRAGLLPNPEQLANIPRLVSAYFTTVPDANDAALRVSFGTSGHRGSSLTGTFNEQHILATSQAICRYRKQAGIDGPLFLGIDTHALSFCALGSALEVFAANGVEVLCDSRDGYTPTPVVSFAILTYNRGRLTGLADGVVITPSHNPPEDGGFKYNPPSGGPADTVVTKWIQDDANALIQAGMRDIKRIPLTRAKVASTTHVHDYRNEYISALSSVVDMDAIAQSSNRLGVDPLGGAGVFYWQEIADRYRLPLEVVSTDVDPTFRFMSLDWDGRIRMDCSSPYAMQRLIKLQNDFDVAWACDTDHDRHGIVARSSGLLNPNHYLAVAIEYLFTHRPAWGSHVGVGKTVVSSRMIDRVAQRLGRSMLEVPVGFKWFVEGLVKGTLGFVGEESAGATLLRRDGSVWTTDKDGMVLGLLAAEMTAVTGKDPGALYGELTREFGTPVYERIDAAATIDEKAALSRLNAAAITATTLAGEPITNMISAAPGNGAAIGGLKVETASGWFAARPSGTEDVYKLYAESFRGREHLVQIQNEARKVIETALRSSKSAPSTSS